ncbi:immunity protein TriTu family protein [Cytobacillus horneckiae]|uniref:immunity protein TriTu family protein n=1 Tax=Cytobacillus horneckiae TaxID=549687 RepID=UPI003D9A38AD
MGRITVWSSKKIDIEVVDFNTGSTKLYEQIEIKDDIPNFDLLLQRYIIEMKC